MHTCETLQCFAPSRAENTKDMRITFYFSSLLACLYVFSWDCVTTVTSISDHHERQKYAEVGVEKLKETNTNEFRNLKKKVLNGTLILGAS